MDGYEQSEEPDSSFSGMGGAVRQNASMDQSGPRQTRAQQNVAMGMSPWAHIGNNPYRKQYDATMAAGAKQKSDPKFKDAEFYTGLGDYGAAEALVKSKGAGLFGMDEAIEIDDEDDQGNPVKNTMYIGPKGNYSVDGANVPAHLLAKKYGVGSVPFKGGDMQAISYRNMISRVQKFTRDLNTLQKLYKGNIYLGTLDPSEDSARARMLESSIKTDYLAIMKDTKGLGGNVSDNDMAIADSMVPQRASNMFSRLGGNESVILQSAKTSALQKLMDVGGANGLELRQSGNQQKRKNSMLESATKDTSVHK
jgi:hypothetical protein